MLLQSVEHPLRRGRLLKMGDATILTSVMLLLVKDLQAVMAKTVYFNSFGDCIRQEDYSLTDEIYTLKATGATGIYHETLICEMTFRSPPDTGICLTFRDFHIEDCGVSLRIYQDSTSSGKQWKKLTCDSNRSPQMCTPERYVTIQLHKRRTNENRNYKFEITVQKSSNLTGNDVILASSVGLFAGIIVGIVVLIVILAAIVLCCCCKPCKSRSLHHTCKPSSALHCTSLQQQALPTAPPAVEILDESMPLQMGAEALPLYPPLPHPYPGTYGVPEQPPPYDPPPYEEHSYSNNKV